ncbi:hypothetical protein QYM36_010255, partial [Artemia franciscana]
MLIEWLDVADYSPSPEGRIKARFHVSGRIDGKPAELLIDSDAFMTIIHKRYVGSLAEKISFTTGMCCVQGD